ncbi:MAG: protein BatD [Methyloprofundus sp.]|nr:protein BatD [Methyloprofundus sp.]
MSKTPALIVFFIFTLISSSLFAAQISVSLDRNPVSLNESLQLTFTATSDPDSAPDFSALEKDFTIVNQSQQQSTQIVNGDYSQSIQWVLNVMAKRTGKLVIPAINFGRDSSQFTSLTVNEVQVVSQRNEDLFLDVEVDNIAPYIQQQVIYTLKFYRKVNIAQASLSEPTLQNAVIEKLGEDKNYNTQYQGESYVVTERKYAIFPQKSELMTIAPLELTASVIVGGGQRRNNSMFNRQRTRVKRVLSAGIKLDVQAKPAEAGDSLWLPATQVILQEQWQDNATELIVGEPITRTVSLFVQGAPASALPELQTNKMPANLKAYPDQAVLKDNGKATGMVALREEKIAIIPNQAGRFTLPAIEVPWWNVTTQKMEIARIPERVVTAVAAPNTSVLTPAETSPTLTQPTVPVTTVATKENSLWFWLTLLFATLWFATLAYFLAKNSKVIPEQTTPIKPKSFAIDKVLKRACANNDSLAAKDALVKWGREQFNVSSLSKIAQQCDSVLSDEILALNAVLYSNNSDLWQGESLWTAFQNKQLVESRAVTDTGALQPLFKI